MGETFLVYDARNRQGAKRQPSMKSAGKCNVRKKIRLFEGSSY